MTRTDGYIPLVWAWDEETSAEGRAGGGGGGGGGAVNVWRKFDGEKFGRNNGDVAPVPFEAAAAAAAAEKYEDRSSEGRNC